MATEKPDLHISWAEWRIYEKHVFLQAWDETSGASFARSGGTAVLAFLGQWWYGFRNEHDTLAMILIAVGAGALVLIGEFAYRLLRAPARIHKRQENDMAALKAASEAFEAEQTRLTVEWRQTPPCSEGPRCRLKIHNTNSLHAAQNVRVHLIGIDPVPRSLPNPVFPMNLPRVDENGRTVNPNCNGYFELFALTMNEDTLRRQAVIRDENEAEQRFDIDDTIQQILCGSYTVSVQASCAVGPPTECRFELTIASAASVRAGNEAFRLTPIRQT